MEWIQNMALTYLLITQCQKMRVIVRKIKKSTVTHIIDIIIKIIAMKDIDLVQNQGEKREIVLRADTTINTNKIS
jgi:hypothetical protein